MRRKLILLNLVVASFYYVSYCAIRASREVNYQGGGYRIISMHNTCVSDGILFSVYRPLIWLDEATIDSEELNLKPE